ANTGQGGISLCALATLTPCLGPISTVALFLRAGFDGTNPTPIPPGVLRRADFYRSPSRRGAPIRKGRDGENADHSDCRRHSNSDGCSRLAADHAAQDSSSQKGPWQGAYSKQGANEE